MQGQGIPGPPNTPPMAGSPQTPILLDTPLSSQAHSPTNSPANSPPDSPAPAPIIPYLQLNRWAPTGESFSKESASLAISLTDQAVVN